jgi:hypothetical protein
MAEMNRRSFLKAAAAAPVAAKGVATHASDAISAGSQARWGGPLNQIASFTLKDALSQRARGRVNDSAYNLTSGFHPTEGYSPGRALKSTAPWFQNQYDAQVYAKRRLASEREELLMSFVPGYREAKVAKEYARLMNLIKDKGVSETAEMVEPDAGGY